MGLYKLKNINDNIEDGIVEKVVPDAIDYEKYFESWLENSPALLLDAEDESTVIWIGRQVTATVGNGGKFPDLIGIDSEGDLIIVELKKGKTPREVIAQILEYASWGATLSYNELNELSKKYYVNDETNANKELSEIYTDVFGQELIKEHIFNKKQKLYIVAENISPSTKQVATYLRNIYLLDINLLEYQVLKSNSNDYLLSIEKILGFEDNLRTYSSVVDIEHGIIGLEKMRPKNKEIVYECVLEITNGDKNTLFEIKDVVHLASAKYPGINISSISCRVRQDCVNHTSRKYYRGGQQDLYFYEDKKYRLYDNSKDGTWNWEGKRID